MSANDQDTDHKLGDLSCLMDGELGQTEARFLLRRAAHEAGVKAQWGRWHRARDVMNGNHCAASSAELNQLSARISAAIEDEPTPVAVTPSTTGFPAVFKPLAGLGVAAAVAAVAISLTSEQEPTVGPETRALAGVESTVEFVPDETPILPISNTTRSVSGGFNQSLDPRMQEYLIRHNALSATRRGQGLVPYRYVVAPNGQIIVEQLEQPEATTRQSAGNTGQSR